MLIKFFRTGQGSGGSKPTDYCCNTIVPTIVSVKNPSTGRIRSKVLRDEAGKPVFKTRNPPPEILAGDREMTRQLIDSLTFKWRYSSGVIAFAPSDMPTEKQQRQLMAEFEQLAFAGMDRERYDILWIRHSHEGSTELHFIVPRVDLLTGKSYNPAPPGWERAFSTLRDSWNWECGWVRPDDPARARLVQPGLTGLTLAENVRAGLTETEEPKALINDYLLACIDAGLVQNRLDIVAKLEDVGMTINRQGKDYISVRARADTKPIRLKGLIYELSFNAENLKRSSTQADQPGSPMAAPELIPIPSDAKEHAADARRRYTDEIAKRACYNGKRYPNPHVLTDKKSDTPSVMAGSVAIVHDVNDVDLAALNHYAASDSANEFDRSASTKNPDMKPNTQTLSLADRVSTDKFHQPKQHAYDADGDTQKRVKRNTNYQDWWQQLKDGYERIRTTSITRFRAIIESIQRGHDHAQQAERAAQRASKQFIETSRQLDQAHRVLDQLTPTNQSSLNLPLTINLSRAREEGESKKVESRWKL